jgi:type II secretory pathway pseudopilin PulG
MHALSQSFPDNSRLLPSAVRRRTSAAFTILEVMMAAAVMALSITTSLTTLQRGFVTLDSARKITLAGQIMQSEFERMRLEDWATISAYPASSDLTSQIAATYAATAAITRSFTVMRAVTDVHADMKQITLTTGWTTYDGRPLSRSYTTCYGKNGLYDYFYNSY